MPKATARPTTGLTPADIRLIGRIADQTVRGGEWRSIFRASVLFCDYFESRL